MHGDRTPLEVATDEPSRRTPDGGSIPDDLPTAAHDEVTGTPLEQGESLSSMAHAATLPLAEDVTVGQPHCQRCEVLPRPLTGPGTLHLNMPHTHTMGKVVTWLAKSGHAHTHKNGTISIPLQGTAANDGVSQMLPRLMDMLAATERRDSRAFFQHAGDELHAADFFQVESLLTFEAQEAAGWLLELLRDDQIVTMFQPLVSCATREVYGYECLMRGQRDATQYAPGPMIDAARKAELLFQLDAAGRRAAVRGACQHDLKSKVFINFTPNAIYDPTHCLHATVRMIDAGGLSRDQVVFEVTESEKLPDMDHLSRIVHYYRDMGFAVALDDVGAGYASLNVLLGLKPDYVKIDMNLIRNVHIDPAKAIIARKLLEVAAELGLKTVAEGVETSDEWDWVREHNADFAQGYYFARPAFVPPVVAA